MAGINTITLAIQSGLQKFAAAVNGDTAALAHVTVDSTGAEKGVSGNPLQVALPSGAQPVSAASLPLPTGAALDATVAAIVTALAGILKVDIQDASVAITASALPLPAGAGTAANQASIAGKLDTLNAAIAAGVAAPLPAGTNLIGVFVEQPIQGVLPMTVGTAITAQRGVRIKCTAAGNVSLQYADGSTDVIPVNVGVNETFGKITTINTSGTTATATYSALV